MRIGELARRAGVQVDTIRHYEGMGLLPTAARDANGYRCYANEHLQRLVFICQCRAFRMPLADVQRLLDFEAQLSQDCGDINRLIDQQLQRVRAGLVQLQALEHQLVNLRAQCLDSRPVQACGILHELKAAAHVARSRSHQD